MNIRDTAGSGSTPGPLFATTGAAGNILRASDSANLGPFSAWRAWGGTVNGASYTVAGVTGSTWEKINLDGAYRYIATPLAAKSAS